MSITVDISKSVDGEEWRDVPNFPLYMVSNKGRFGRRYTGKQSIPNTIRVQNMWKHKDGYIHCSAHVNGVKMMLGVHVMVATAFICVKPEGKTQVNHKNGIKDDNSPCNLEWVTNKENAVHAQANGLFKQHRGSMHGRSTVNESQVREIRSLIAAGISQHKTAAIIGCTRGVVKLIKEGRTWKHLE